MKNLILMVVACILTGVTVWFGKDMLTEEPQIATYKSTEEEHKDYLRSKCLGDDAKQIEALENELANCRVIMDDDVISTADMNEAHYQSMDCAMEVVYKIFDTYYTKYNQQAKDNFYNLTKYFYACAHDMIQYSDFGRENNNGTMHNTMAITEGSYNIRKFAENYIEQLWIDCAEKQEWL